MTDFGGWIAVDLDGTLAHYDGWGDGSIGAPIPAMQERVRGWLALGVDVRIFTARVGPQRDDADELERQVELIRAWTLEHLGQEVPATCVKDFGMVELWDDRAIRVKKNEGAPCCASGGHGHGETLSDLHARALAQGQGRHTVKV